MFAQRVLPVTEDIMFKWRLLVEDDGKVGHTFSQPDLIIAAIALEHGLTIVSRDAGDYEKRCCGSPASVVTAAEHSSSEALRGLIARTCGRADCKEKARTELPCGLNGEDLRVLI